MKSAPSLHPSLDSGRLLEALSELRQALGQEAILERPEMMEDYGSDETEDLYFPPILS